MKSHMSFTVSILSVLLTLTLIFQNCGTSTPGASTEKSSDDDHHIRADSDIPTVVLAEKPDNFSKLSDANFEIVANDVGAGIDRVEYKIDDSSEWKGCGNFLYFDSLSQGHHKIYFRAYDKKNNVSKTVAHTWVVDDSLPVITLTQKPALITTSTSATFQISVQDSLSTATILKCSIDNVELANCSSGTVSKSGLSYGAHTFRATVEDQAENVQNITYTWGVSTDANVVPAPEFTSTPAAYVKAASVALNIETFDVTNLPNSDLFCWLDGVSMPCRPFQRIVLTLAEKKNASGAPLAYTFETQVKFNNKLSAKKSISWFIDRTAPVVNFVTKPSAFLTTNSAKIKFNVTELGMLKSITCKLDNDLRQCASMTDVNLESLTSGSHTFKVTALDMADNEEVNEATWSNTSCSDGNINMRWPMNGQEGFNWTVLSHFDDNERGGQKRDFGGRVGAESRASDNHAGISITTGDMSTLGGEFAKVYAAEAGRVTHVENSKRDGQVYLGSSLNACHNEVEASAPNYVEILHANGYRTRYIFLKKGSIPVTVGSMVSKGTFLGVLGTSGCLAFPRFYFETRNCAGMVINPVTKNLFDQNIQYAIAPQIVNMTLHEGIKNLANVTDLRAVIVSGVHKTSYVRNTAGVTLKAFLSASSYAGDIYIELYNPNNDRVVRTQLSKADALGKLIYANSGKLNIAGNWVWKIKHIRSVNSVSTTTVIGEQTFTVTTN